jgi:hypothetical protein
MADPVLYESEVCAGVKQVRGNRVLERMEVTLALRNPGLLDDVRICNRVLSAELLADSAVQTVEDGN